MKKTFVVTGQKITVSSRLVKSGAQFPNGGLNLLHNCFSISVSTECGKISFYFFDSAANFQAGKIKLNERELKNALYCFYSDAVAAKENNLDSFMLEYGYKHRGQANKILKACNRQLQKAEKLCINIYDAVNELND